MKYWFYDVEPSFYDLYDHDFIVSYVIVVNIRGTDSVLNIMSTYRLCIKHLVEYIRKLINRINGFSYRMLA